MKLFAEPIITVETFAIEDVVTTSGEQGGFECPTELERD